MKKLLPTSLSFIALLLISLVLPLTVAAHEAGSSGNSEHISNFQVDATLSPNNVMKVQEVISYDFGSLSKHGIYRNIPIEYADASNQYFLTANVTSVLQDGKKATTEKSSVNGNLQVKIGDADETITGEHVYTIDYELSPLIYKQGGQPFLNFDAIGTGWSVPIEHAKILVSLASGAAFSNALCYSGSQGSTADCQLVSTTATTLSVDKSDLASGNGITLNANLPADYINAANYLVANQKPPISRGAIIAIAVGIVLGVGTVIAVIGGIIISILRSIKRRRLRAQQTIIPHYEPPSDLSVGEIGLLEDDSADTVEVTATIISLATRGYLRITQLPEPSGIGKLFSKQDYQLTILKPLDDVDSLERELVMALLSGLSEIKLSDVDKRSAAAAVIAYKAQLKASLSTKGYYAEGGGFVSKGNLTESGAQQWAVVKGFKLFLSTTEKDRLAFTDAPSRTPEQFSALLPYAIALGVEKQWAEQFSSIDVSQATSWYDGNNIGMFSAAALASSLNDGFQDSLQSNSSVSSSGGASGGGFGGGGGGSW